jgi:hypothetical protein
MKSDFGGWGRVYSGVALTSLATLLFELSLTRIFSVVFYYHFAFLAISIALFGLGAGGEFSYVLPVRLGWLSALNSLLVCLGLAVALLQKPGAGNWSLAPVYFTAALPFCGAGVILSSVIAETIERVGRVYFCDLLGAAGGCLLHRRARPRQCLPSRSGEACSAGWTGAGIRTAPRRKDTGHRTRRWLGCAAVACGGQPRHHWRGD